MASFIDITNNKYNRWRVLSKTKNRAASGSVMWLCECSCGTIKEVSAYSLRDESSKSCGCLKIKNKLEPDIKSSVHYITKGDICLGKTTNTNRVFYFDLGDYDRIKKYSWHESTDGYVISSTYKGINGAKRATFLHEVITNVKFDTDHMIDHIDGDKFNNLRKNLRVVTYSQNSMNTSIRKDNKSGCKGVSYDKKSNMWFARISFKKNNFSLGYFQNKLEAIRHREIAELYLFKEYSREHGHLKNKYKNIDIIEFLKEHHPKIIKQFPIDF